MKPIRIELPKEMFSPAEIMSIAEDSVMDTLELGPDTYTFPNPVHWDVYITNTGKAFLVTGTVEGISRTACARCLEDAEFDFKGDIEGYFVTVDHTDDLDDDIEEDEYGIVGEDKSIDLAPLIENAVILAIPRTTLCSKECKGLCPKCGANLNLEDCGCESNTDDDDDSSNPFSILKSLEF